jgi:hypothetical protein
MRGAIPTLPQNAFMASCSVKEKCTMTTLPVPQLKFLLASVRACIYIYMCVCVCVHAEDGNRTGFRNVSLSLVCSRFVCNCACVFLGLFVLYWYFCPFACSDLCVGGSLIATCVFLASSVCVYVPRYVALWFVIGPCVICLWTFVFFDPFQVLIFCL